MRRSSLDGIIRCSPSGRHCPADIRVTAETEDGVVMAIEHESEPIAAVQFHPESIMSLDQDAGHKIIENVVERLVHAQRQEIEAAS